MSSIALHTETLRKNLKSRMEEGILVSEVFLVACGGSLVDLYPSKYFLASESRRLRSELYTANEFVHAVPKVLGKGSVVILCSHSGETPEVIKALKVAKTTGALTVTLTHGASSAIVDFSEHTIVYDWGDETKVKNNPMAIALALCVETQELVEGLPEYDDFQHAMSQIDQVVAGACKQVEQRADLFAEAYQQEQLYYVLSSGASYGHAYGFAICSLMEMQWLDASGIHSGEFFHGPFEITDHKTNFIVLLNEDRTRPLDERVITFLEQYAKRYIVVDARELGLGVLPKTVVEFFNPVLFYSVLCKYREALAKIRKHPLEKRRYMGIVDY